MSISDASSIGGLKGAAIARASAFAVDQGAIPEDAKKALPRYPLVGATLIGRLAVGSAHRGRRLGAILLATIGEILG